VIAYRATLEVPSEPGTGAVRAEAAAGAAAAARNTLGQAGAVVLWASGAELRWFSDSTTAEALACDHGISWATAYRYLDEAMRCSP
jgi:hypothetical protein